MADETRDRDGCSIAASGIGSHRSDSSREIKQAAKTLDGVDFISSMPDEIIHSILYYLPTPFAIITSALSRRWRHVWCETSCVDFDEYRDIERRPMTDREINQILNSYNALKIKRFHVCMETQQVTKPQIDSWIEFAISRNVEKLSLFLSNIVDHNYRFPYFFYLSSSLVKLSVGYLDMFPDMFPECTVSWKSLRKLTLNCCYLNDESIANILSGSPVLETLIFYYCMGLERLDLSKFHSLRRLEIDNDDEGPTEIVAPYIRYLNLKTCDHKPCTLVDVSFLTEASLDIYILQHYSDDGVLHPLNFQAGFLQTAVLKMLTKLQNVERLTLGGTLLQILSLAELRGVSFPTFKVQTLTVETKFVRSFIPGTTRLLQNSPGLKKLIVEETNLVVVKDMDVHSYLDSQGFNPVQCWRSKHEVFPTSVEYCRMVRCEDSTWKLVASFIEMVLRNVPTLKMLVLGLKHIDQSFRDAKWFEELLLPTFSNNNNVSIVLKR